MSLTREQIREISENTPVSLDGTVAELQEYGEKCIYKALSALAPDAAKWRAIESAPKDGRDIIICRAGIGEVTRIGFWDVARGGVWSVWPGRARSEPTHWQPLPPPPAAEE